MKEQSSSRVGPFARSWPELARVDASDRRKLYRAAFRPVLRSWRYWGIALALQAVAQVAFRMAGAELAYWLPDYAREIRFLAPAVGAGIAGGVTVWLVQQRIKHNLRLLLNKRGLPTCVPCGYDLTGNVSGACPECGTTIEQP